MVSTSKTPQIDPEQSFLYFRVSIGGVCFLFLFVLIVGRMIFERQIGVLDAISDYYYSSSMHNVFVGGLSALAALLICYRYEERDTVASFFAGIFALGVALCPEASPSWYLKQHPTVQVTDTDMLIGKLHWAFAAGFLVIIALIVLGLFRSYKEEPIKRSKKYIRNGWYTVLGVLMFLSAVLCLIFQVIIMPRFTVVEGAKPIFWFESAALVLFITAWIIKGQALLWDDTRGQSTVFGIFKYFRDTAFNAWESFRGVFPTEEQQASEAADFFASLTNFFVSTKKGFTPPLQADSTADAQSQQREDLVMRVINTARALGEVVEKREGDIGSMGKVLTDFADSIEKESMPPQTDSPSGGPDIFPPQNPR